MSEDKLIYLEQGNPYGIVGYVTKEELRKLHLDYQIAEAMWDQFYEMPVELLNGKIVLH